MVSLWPWKGNANSSASFEKELISLANKITKSQGQLDSLRQHQRRFKALWTLYTSFAYLLCFVVLFLVVGWQNWGMVEYSALSGAPVLIYLVRSSLTTYYGYRIDTVTQRLDDQQAERTKTIEKLKAATKYNSTQELLEKYGGATPKPKKAAVPKGPKIQHQPNRTSTGPPATANIQRPDQVQIPSQPSTPQPLPQRNVPQHLFPSPYSSPKPQPQAQPVPARSAPQAEFAPNAYSAPPQYAQSAESVAGGNWYDRVLDLLMGEDETSPKNRVALICQNCRLVNGQAPPGTKSLSDLGRWRCFGCGAMNGEEDEAVKVVKEMKERIEIHDPASPTSGEDNKGAEDSGSGEIIDAEDDDDDDGEKDDSADEKVVVKPRRGRSSRKNA
ncbi:uncharacterized protein RAG0_07936 [Rhynchosporium agropyri]|uniref:Endoplasmic reticulum junction formation protein lunapark n=1 Tax=Rhynchosporium agropyri TaxID=914238 RepID=A0A1E1KNL5_9HELO|nr:uncharacterized protein RAG0_07936 [Rhynchosporium agropyri]